MTTRPDPVGLQGARGRLDAPPVRRRRVLAGVGAGLLGASLPDAAIAKICLPIGANLPNVGPELCARAGLHAGEGRSVRGLPLWQRDVVPPQPRLRVLVLGGIHGDEVSSVSVALHWIALAQDPRLPTPVPVHWRFVPALNPDGLRMARAQRTNARGVDLNRNFPTPGWAQDAPRYWEKSTQRDPRRWPGPKPLSEPESRFVVQQMALFKPHLIVSIHAPYGVLDFDGPSIPPQRLGRLYLDQVGIFPGSLGNYAGVHKGVPVVTVELGHATRTPLDADIRQMWTDLGRWIGERLGAQPPSPR